MHDPFDNPEIAAASHQRGGGGWVVDARPVPAAPANRNAPCLPAGAFLFLVPPRISAWRMPCPSASWSGALPAAFHPVAQAAVSPAPRGH